MRDVKRLSRLLCDKLDTIDPSFGIERMRLMATQADLGEMSNRLVVAFILATATAVKRFDTLAKTAPN